jgi:hypothetical protein
LTPVLAEPYDGCSCHQWQTEEGGSSVLYTQAQFEQLFEKIDMQAEQAIGPDRDIFGFDYSWCQNPDQRALINDLLGIEAISMDNSIDDGCSWKFKPYPLSTFGKLLDIAVNDMDSMDRQIPDEHQYIRLLEIGCGVGPKLVVANKIFGLNVRGFDHNEEYCDAAIQLLKAKKCSSWLVQKLDAFEQEAVALYSQSDIIYLNRPFVHLEMQAALERQVFAEMQSGAYIILANYAADIDAMNEAYGWRKLAVDKVAVVLQKP